MNEFKIVEEKNLENLSRHENAWDHLMLEVANAGPTQSYSWIYSYFKHKISSRFRWVCLFAYHKEQLAGVYPLIILQKKGFPGLYFQFFQAPHDPFHTVRNDGLIYPGNEKHILELFFKHLQRSFKAIPIIWIPGIPEFRSSYRYFSNQKRNLQTFKKADGVEDIIVLPDNYETYVNNLNPKFRREIFRQERRLKEKGEVSYIFRDASMSNKESLDIFAEVENSGWKGIKKTSIKENPGDLELFSDATGSFNKNGWMQWNFLKADKEFIAAQLAVKINRVIYLWKIGYREEYSSYAPGNLLMYKFIEDAFSQGDAEEINFMNERGWLKEWKVDRRNIFSLAIFPGIPIVSFMLKMYYRYKYKNLVKPGFQHKLTLK